MPEALQCLVIEKRVFLRLALRGRWAPLSDRERSFGLPPGEGMELALSIGRAGIGRALSDFLRPGMSPKKLSALARQCAARVLEHQPTQERLITNALRDARASGLPAHYPIRALGIPGLGGPAAPELDILSIAPWGGGLESLCALLAWMIPERLPEFIGALLSSPQLSALERSRLSLICLVASCAPQWPLNGRQAIQPDFQRARRCGPLAIAGALDDPSFDTSFTPQHRARLHQQLAGFEREALSAAVIVGVGDNPLSRARCQAL